MELNNFNDLNKQLLEDYAAELGIGNLSLKALIDSHKHLRSLNLEHKDKFLQGWKEGYDKGYESGKASALEYHYISIERLQAMTLKELVEFLREE